MFRPKSVDILSASILILVACYVVCAQPPQVRSVVVQPSLVNYTGPCPVTITFLGKIRMSGLGEVKCEWRRSDGATGPMQTLVFPAPGELEVTDTWQLGEPGFSEEVRWKSLRVLAPQVRDSNQGAFRLRCQGAGQGQGAAEDPQPGEQHGPGLGLATPDLIVSIVIPRPNDANPRAFFHVRNNGLATAPGTVGTHDPDHGFMIDVVLSTDGEMPAEPAVFSPNFSEDVMIRGGRISRTADLPARAARPYSLTVEIPANTPVGNYFLCARIDPFDRVVESIEANNVACTPFNVVRRQ